MARQPFTEREVNAMITGTIRQMVKDNKYYYHSSVGADYSHFTDEGKEAVMRQVELLGGYLVDAIKNDDERRSKDLVLKELKGQ